ncbi:HNH endonuclease [Paenibacillus sp. PsM32]|uniref:HNH endonuclease n=1 Tax=Paenibacillus sp. PsM32 TaxID=3030536 RepID=UPI00263AB94F|nr:HNH endonuclease [Paenibacillus sp. PsM32]MDN4619756.1 HNH endonuclease [Paenibacillus sp. PsM32]
MDKQKLQNELHNELLKAAKIASSIGYNPHIFNQMLASEGGYAVAKKLIHKVSSGFEKLWEINRLDLSAEAVMLNPKFKDLFTQEEIDTAKMRLKEFGYEIEEIILPILQPSGRKREYDNYQDEIKAKVIYEHLANGLTHRELDEKVLGLDRDKSKGLQSMNILHYLGMKADYKGIFEGKELNEVLNILKKQDESFTEAVRLLILLTDEELINNINSDLKAELEEEGHRIEGQVKYYYGKRYERDSKNRLLAVKKHGLNCYTCGFNFEAVYGERGKDFIEVHHIKPLSTLEEATEVNPETDLVPLCANCHRMIHRRKEEILSPDELKVLIEKFKNVT